MVITTNLTFIKSNLLNTTHTEERSVPAISESCNQLNQLNSKQIIQILQSIFIDIFSIL